MVCVPCIVIPVLLWVFHKYIQPFILKFWNPWQGKSLPDADSNTIPDGVKADDPQYTFIVEKTKSQPVVLFTKPTCSFCKMACEVLDGLSVEYTCCDISQREDMDKIQDMFAKMTDARTVPRVFVGGRCVGGGSELWSLHNRGGLVPLLRKAGAQFNDPETKKSN